MLLLFVEKNSPRFNYVAKLVFNNLLGIEFKVTKNLDEFKSSPNPKICYSRVAIDEGIFIQSSGLLFESDISDQSPKSSFYKDTFVFFTTGTRSDLPYDPLAAIFFLVSRYEEYLPFIADEHNRFPARESFQFKNKVLDKPLVNIYAGHIADILTERYPGLPVRKRTYSFTNSVDIDNAYAYLGKGLMRSIGGFIKDWTGLNLAESLKRFRTIAGLDKDPFDTFDYQLALQEKYGFETIYFALFSKFGQYDRSLTMESPRLQRHLKSINDFCEVGIHPSYRSNENSRIAEEELRSLEKTLNTNVSRSRQHFLKLKFPETYRNLLNMDITDDYSMGYAEVCGFRAGICTSFRFYDLELEVETPLTVHPFPFMDGTFIYYLEKSIEEAWLEIEQYLNTYKRYGGDFIPIWHYRIFSEKDEEWKGWNQLFEKMVRAAV